MSLSLAGLTCETCGKDSPNVSVGEVREYLQQLPGWNVLEDSGVNKLTRSFEFCSYANSLVFVNDVAALAEKANHHPFMHFEFRCVRVHWWTHAIGGLHLNDFIMAAKTDELFAAS